MGTKLGNLDTSKFYIGSSDVDKVYLGTDAVYSKSSPRLPSEYQEVTYLQSHGTEYIDTGYYASTSNSNTYECMFAFNSIDADATIFGATQDTSALRVYNSSDSNVTAPNSFAGTTSLKATDTNDHLIGLYTSGTMGGVGFDGITSRGRFWFSTKKTLSTNLFLFADSNSGVARYNSQSKIYYFKIYESNAIVRDFVPCYRKEDNVIGMYEVVNNIFYTNSGTGTFEKGQDVN